MNVDTSPICASVTAMPGPGNILGNLLCNLANAVNGGTASTYLQNLQTNNPTDFATLTGGIASLLDSTLGNAVSPALGATPAVPATNILNLTLGPVNLNLLGLQVTLDNCSGGPITVNITAQPGPGNLLGNLLSGLANALNGTGGLLAINPLLTEIAGEISSLL